MVLGLAFLPLLLWPGGVAMILPGGGSRWVEVKPGGDTSCARGDPFTFWFRPGRKDRLLVYFQGGGLCWNAETCAPGSSYYLDRVTQEHHPSLQSGIFDIQTPNNPFRSYSMLYIPYCTGDLHVGNHAQVYPNPDQSELVVEHKGYANASAALSYAYEKVPDPRQVFVTGCSAGSVGSILHTPGIIEHYSQADVAQLGDSLVFDYPAPPDLLANYHAGENLPNWIPAVAEMATDHFRLTDFYTTTAHHYPQASFSQFSYNRDDVQDFFYTTFGGEIGGLPDSIRASLDAIGVQASNFRYYLAGGADHCIMGLESFYGIQSGGVLFRDWVDGLATGKDIPNVHP